MSITLLKDQADYIDNASEQLLLSPDLAGASPGKYVVEEDGVPIYDATTDEVYKVEVVA